MTDDTPTTTYDLVTVGGHGVGMRNRETGVYTPAVRCEPARAANQQSAEAAGPRALGGSMSEWQPIETAPKDVEVLVWSPTWGPMGRVFLAKWQTNQYAVKPRPYWSYSDERIWGTTMVRQKQPTHWMPKPEPPK